MTVKAKWAELPRVQLPGVPENAVPHTPAGELDINALMLLAHQVVAFAEGKGYTGEKLEASVIRSFLTEKVEIGDFDRMPPEEQKVFVAEQNAKIEAIKERIEFKIKANELISRMHSPKIAVGQV